MVLSGYPAQRRLGIACSLAWQVLSLEVGWTKLAFASLLPRAFGRFEECHPAHGPGTSYESRWDLVAEWWLERLFQQLKILTENFLMNSEDEVLSLLIGQWSKMVFA
jgi:hypothetical protein